MYNAGNRGIAKAYKRQELLTAPREKVIAYLYQGLESFVLQSQKALDEGNIQGAGEYIGRAQGIVWELLGALNMEEGGEIAENLSRLYRYMINRIVEANLKKDRAPLDDVLGVLAEVKEGWNEMLAQRTSS